MEKTTVKLKTDREAFYDITADIRQAISASKVKSGICVVYCPHTTAAITVNENADEHVAQDVLLGARTAFPSLAGFKHDEGNSAGHVKSSMFGVSLTLIIENGAPVLGRWQNVYFCEFDPPRSREFYIKIMSD